MVEDSSQPQEKGKDIKISQPTHFGVNDIPPKSTPQKALTEWCVKNILDIKCRLDNLQVTPKVENEQLKPTKSSVKSPWVWIFALIVIGVIGYLAFALYAQSKGYSIRLPSFLK